ncbi:uncharacterized protein LOC123543528 [Mercenaria mercenaria]|uniref:uncharacterized protein LOC123543528 n=1 Tax=Mercenaria mercenaria TaxID=6596 RepID=UPI00234F5288|nr:uncharacterized protein LOC123543528 [Mercenaria mercenaria]XP_045185541.2 uncharacterized protein LOC123543528 [Mercenaria mercenaria]
MPKKSKTQRPVANIQQTSTFQYLIILILLTVLNISFFFGLRNPSVPLQCSSDTLMQVVSLYLTSNGQTTLKNLLPSQCSDFSKDSEKELKTAIRQLLSTCEHSRGVEKSVVRTGPLVTLFTTFADHFHTDSEKIIVHNNTLTNWASFMPSVNLILFSNDTYWTRVARSLGWDVIKPINENNGTKPPILKDMFRLAMARYKTNWYGYVNADILFTSDILLNLEMFTRKYNTSASRILLTGRRTNVDNLTSLDPLSEKNIKEHAKKFGQLYKEDAEDFFLTTSSFPWQNILPVVVGRPGYDNWLVGEARCRLNTTVIDVTQSLLAFHQTTKKGGNSEGHYHHDSDFNFNVLKKNKIVPNFLAGLTDCIIYYTYRTFCDTLEIGKRTHFGPQCDCKFKPRRN